VITVTICGRVVPFYFVGTLAAADQTQIALLHRNAKAEHEVVHVALSNLVFLYL